MRVYPSSCPLARSCRERTGLGTTPEGEPQVPVTSRYEAASQLRPGIGPATAKGQKFSDSRKLSESARYLHGDPYREIRPECPMQSKYPCGPWLVQHVGLGRREGEKSTKAEFAGCDEIGDKAREVKRSGRLITWRGVEGGERERREERGARRSILRSRSLPAWHGKHANLGRVVGGEAAFCGVTAA
jgi:hypothetical protein